MNSVSRPGKLPSKETFTYHPKKVESIMIRNKRAQCKKISGSFNKWTVPQKNIIEKQETKKK